MHTLATIVGHDPYDLARAWDIPRAYAKQLTTLAETYFATTTNSRKQHTARTTATTRGYSLHRLLKIETYTKKITTHLDHHAAWRLREELINYTGSIEELTTYATKRVTDLLGQPTPKKSVRFSTSTNGMRTAHITLDEHTMATWEKTLDTHRQHVANDLPRSAGLARGLEEFLTTNPGLIPPAYATMIIVGIDKLATIYTSDNPEEVTVALTDGTTMTGKDYLEAQAAGYFTDDVFAGLFQPGTGPINLYNARFADIKQRLLAMAENPICPWPGCSTPADQCQVHHLKAHKHGGATTPSNLSMACGYHNGVNDDDPTPAGSPAKPGSRGRLDRIDGHVVYTSPGGHRHTNDHPVAKLGAMHLI